MVKRYINILPSPLNNLFAPNNTDHNHYTRQNKELHINIGQGENV